MTATHFHHETPEAVRRALENARLNGTRVRLFYGDTKTGRAWAEENDVAGTIGRSMGAGPNPIRIPLLIPNARSMGGGGVLDHCIVAIATGPGRFAYRHPGFDPGQWTVAEGGTETHPVEVLHDGKRHGLFVTRAKAERYAAFMRGDRMAK